MTIKLIDDNCFDLNNQCYISCFNDVINFQSKS